MKKLFIATLILVIFMSLTVGCRHREPGPAELPSSIILATTTSTYDSGLLHVLLPMFTAQYGIAVDVISVGTGAAVEIGKRGDCDIILVHSRALEDAFVADGFGTKRWDVMYNDYVYVGPTAASLISDSEDLTQALQQMVDYMVEHETSFLSRGDSSGTHNKEQSLWPAAGVLDLSARQWYLSIGQGMGDTLVAANEMRAFTLADRGTYLAMQANLPGLTIVFSGDDALSNPYGIIPVNPEKHVHVEHAAAMLLVEFFLSAETQASIREFGVSEYGQSLFFPNANP